MPTRRVKSSERRRCARACTTCKRRKERCDGSQPCGRCIRRNVGVDCEFSTSPRPLACPRQHRSPMSSPGEAHPIEFGSGPNVVLLDGLNKVAHGGQEQIPSPSPLFYDCSGQTPVPQVSRLIKAGPDELMFIGDAANLSFLQVIRGLVHDSPWASPFSGDPLRHLMIEATPAEETDWMEEAMRHPPSIPDPEEVRYLLHWYLLATNCVLNIFNAVELRKDMEDWLQKVQQRPESRPEHGDAIFFLILAVGAQACPEDRDGIAARYFNYGRFVTLTAMMGAPSLLTIRAGMLMTMYLLVDARRNAAFMCLGIATRAAYALGIHRTEINSFYKEPECAARERLWKVLRVLDLFLSASLGRPPSTTETRDTTSTSNYSATNDLCAIFESILTQVYSRRTVSSEVIERITERHRSWTTRYSEGLEVDDIPSGEFIDSDGGQRTPNVGLCHLKEAYYWTIMLLSRPFLIETVAKKMSRTTALGRSTSNETGSSTPSDQILSHACVDSAVRTVELLSDLISTDQVPKRLPFVVNSTFVAALVVGLAQLGDFDCTFPLEKSLQSAQRVLSFFGAHDAVAKRNAAIIENLQDVCLQYVQERTRQKMTRQSLLVGGLFGTVHTRSQSNDLFTRDAACLSGRGKDQLPWVDVTAQVRTQQTSATGPQTPVSSGAPAPCEQINQEDDGLEPLPDLGTLTHDMFLSPMTLMFDSFGNNMPLFSTVDAAAMDFGNFS